MAFDLKDKLVIGISSSVLFDLENENAIYIKEGKEAYCKYQSENENMICKPGVGFAFIQTLTKIKEKLSDPDMIEVILMSHNRPDVSLRLFHSISYYGLKIQRSVFTSGSSLIPYMKAFQLDLFLSENRQDVYDARKENIAVGYIDNTNLNYLSSITNDDIRFAFDGDAVLFSNASELIYQQKGLKEFEKHEQRNACIPMQDGPLAGVFRKLFRIKSISTIDDKTIHIAVVTSRSAPAHERMIRTLRSWNIQPDEMFFLGGIAKTDVLSAYGAHIFFDDQMIHVKPASDNVFSALILQDI